MGGIKTWEKNQHGLTGTSAHGRFRIMRYGENVIRVTFTRADEFENFSYAVISEPSVDGPWSVADGESEITLKGSAFYTVIDKKNTSVSFTTRDGIVINEDDHAFGTSWIGEQVTCYKKIQTGERFVGLGEKTGPLDRRGAGYVNWNTDNFAYGPGADPLYSSIPFYIGIHNGLAYGIFFDNTHKTFFNFGASNDRFSSFAADAGEMNYYFIYAASVAEIIRHYTALTGRMELPPLWSIGYQQCRYSYYPDKEVLSVANTFREKEIPADAIVLDIHYMEKYKIFTWSKRDFPDPGEMIRKLSEQGFRVVVMCDPGIKVEPGYHTYDDGIQHDVFIKYPDGTNYTGQVWPGWCHFPDFTDPKTRAWWKEQLRAYTDMGIDGYWNDMNEIATWGNMLPENIEMSFEGHQSTIRRGRNIYGFQMARSTYEGTRALMGKRPFNLTRSGFAGIQRYAAVWTGDNVAYDEHMMLGVRIVNSMGLSGVAFAGYDVGGFVGNADSRLFARWLSIGAFSPFFRGHSMINSRDTEPWSYGEEVEQISRNYIRFRYQLLPYIYSAFYEAATYGMPVQRSLAIEHTHDDRVYDHQYQHQYLFGPNLLIAPVESNNEFVKVYLPEGDGWYSLYDGKWFAAGTAHIVEAPLHRLPVFVRAGAMIPMQTPGAHTGQKSELLTVHVYAGASGSRYVYYEDDGESFAYQTSDQYHVRKIDYLATANRLVFQVAEGKYVSAFKKLRIVFHGFDYGLRRVTVNGEERTLAEGVNRFFAGLEKFDPIKDPEPAPEENVVTCETDYHAGEIVIQW